MIFLITSLMDIHSMKKKKTLCLAFHQLLFCSFLAKGMVDVLAILLPPLRVLEI